MFRQTLWLTALTLLASACAFARNRAIAFEPDWLGANFNPLWSTWDLDVSQSVFRLEPRVQRQTRVYSPAPSSEHFVLDGVSAAGDHQHAEYTAGYDGKDYLMTGVPGVNTVSLHRVTPFQTDAIERLDGRVVAEERRTLSPDRRVLVITVHRPDATGELAFDSLVLRRR